MLLKLALVSLENSLFNPGVLLSTLLVDMLLFVFEIVCSVVELFSFEFWLIDA